MSNIPLWKPRIIFTLATIMALLFMVACGAAEESPAEPAGSSAEPAAPAQSQPEPAAPAAASDAPAQAPAAASSDSGQAAAAPAPTAAPSSAGAAPAAAPQSDAPTGTLRIALDEIGPPKWIPKLQGAPQNSINNTTFWESLWRNEKEAGLVGVLAESWEISDDATVWTINLHQGVPFHHDYGELTANDFVFTMENSVEEGTTRSPRLLNLHFFAEGGGMTVVDDYTFEIDTVNPAWSLPWDVATGMTAYMGTGVISQKYYEEYGEEQAGFSLAVGTGPWKSIEHVTGGTWRFEAVQDHWRKTPNFAELHYAEISEESTRLANFLANKLDIATFNLESVAQLEEQCSDCKFKTFTTGAQLFLNIHGNLYVDRADLPTPRDPSLPWVSASADMNSADWINARKVRKAMAISIDRQLLVDTLLLGKGEPAHVYGWAGFEDELGYLADLKHEYDPDMARQLLAEAGYPDGFEVPMALTNRPYPGTIETAAAVATMWEDIGIRTTQIRQPMSAFRPNFVERSWKGINSHGNNVSSEPLLSRTQTYAVAGVVNYGVEHPMSEELNAKIETTFDREERLELVRQLTKFLYDEVFTIPTVSIYHIWPLGPEVDDWTWTFPVVRVPSNLEYIPHRE